MHATRARGPCYWLIASMRMRWSHRRRTEAMWVWQLCEAGQACDTRWNFFVKLVGGNFTMRLHRVTWQLKHAAPLLETLSAAARVGRCSTFRETVSGNFLKRFHKTCRVTWCNFRRNLYRVAVSRKNWVSPCNIGFRATCQKDTKQYHHFHDGFIECVSGYRSAHVGGKCKKSCFRNSCAVIGCWLASAWSEKERKAQN